MHYIILTAVVSFIIGFKKTLEKDEVPKYVSGL